MTEKKELFHGTTFGRLDWSTDGRDFFGARYVGINSESGTLTDDNNYAVRCAQATSLEFGGWPAVVRFEIPEGDLVDEGPIRGQPDNGARGYSSRLTVDPKTLPDDYLKHLGLSRESVEEAVKSGKMEFYRVPVEYRKGVDRVR